MWPDDYEIWKEWFGPLDGLRNGLMLKKQFPETTWLHPEVRTPKRPGRFKSSCTASIRTESSNTKECELLTCMAPSCTIRPTSTEYKLKMTNIRVFPFICLTALCLTSHVRLSSKRLPEPSYFLRWGEGRSRLPVLARKRHDPSILYSRPYGNTRI